MNTPIYDFLEKYKNSGTVRAHMPGHKGRSYGNAVSNSFPYDITEIKGADSLFDADGIIAASERNASDIFGSAKTLYSAGGSTLSIQTMLALACRPGDTVLAARNAHKAFINSCVLLDLNISWIFPKKRTGGSIISYEYSAEDVEEALISYGNISAVYITSPDYYGKMSDIYAIAKVCRKYKTALLVDNAHGAHLTFLDQNLHPLHLGADMCADSAHKTLPVLTGGGYLHIKNEKYTAYAKDTMALFASTSPSYLVMASLDLCNKYISENICMFQKTADKVRTLKETLSSVYTFADSEPFRMTVYTPSNGMYGTQFSDILRESGIECEYADQGYAVLMFSVFSSDSDYERVYRAMKSIKMPKIRIEPDNYIFPEPEKVLSVRCASLSENEEVPINESLGRICGKTKVICPPGIPLIAPGEKIDEDCINILNKYRIFNVNVVK